MEISGVVNVMGRRRRRALVVILGDGLLILWLLVLWVIGFLSSGNFLVLSTATTDRDVTKSAAFGPVPTTCLAKVTRLGEAVIVVVAKFGVR